MYEHDRSIEFIVEANKEGNSKTGYHTYVKGGKAKGELRVYLGLVCSQSTQQKVKITETECLITQWSFHYYGWINDDGWWPRGRIR